MTLVVQKPTGGKLLMQKPTGAKLMVRSTWAPSDPDAAAYITAVQAADGQALEQRVAIAIDDFVLGCKADGIWTAIKASCILAGARTLTGALVPLVGTAPTNFNFVSGDYNRKTGLVGDGSSKYLNSNRAGNADPRNSVHLCIYASVVATLTRYYAGSNDSSPGATTFYSASSTGVVYKPRTNTITTVAGANVRGLIGFSRSNGSSFVSRNGGVSTEITQASQPPASDNFGIFQAIGMGLVPSDARLAFYSIGESLDLTLLDARVKALVNAFAAAIP
jgi:hypothetical protein